MAQLQLLCKSVHLIFNSFTGSYEMDQHKVVDGCKVKELLLFFKINDKENVAYIFGLVQHIISESWWKIQPFTHWFSLWLINTSHSFYSLTALFCFIFWIFSFKISFAFTFCLVTLCSLKGTFWIKCFTGFSSSWEAASVAAVIWMDGGSLLG